MCVPGKWKQLLSRDVCGEGFGGGVVLTLEGSLFCKCAGEEGAEEVADDALLLESRWFVVGVGSYTHRHTQISSTLSSTISRAELKL